MERPLYVLISSLIVHALFHFWQPMDQVLWGNPDATLNSYAVIVFGWVFTFLSTLCIDHFDLFGLRQCLQLWDAPSELKFFGFYKFVRHPIMTGFLITFWATPYMTASRFMFSFLCTGYIIVGVCLEEMDLVSNFGDDYLEYKQNVGGILPGCPFGYCASSKKMAKTE